MQKFLFLVFIFCFFTLYGQQNCSLKIQLDSLNHTLLIEQVVEWDERSEWYFSPWINAYATKTSELTKKKLEDRKTDLYFAKKDKRGGLLSLKTNGVIQGDWKSNFFSIKRPKESFLQLIYEVQLPPDIYSKMGYNEAKEYLLKDFILLPNHPSLKNGSHPNFGLNDSFYPEFNFDVEWVLNNDWYIYSNLNPVGENTFQGTSKSGIHFELRKSEIYSTIQLGDKTIVVPNELHVPKDSLAFVLQRQLDFFENYLPQLDKAKIFISKEEFKSNRFEGIDNVWIIKLFSEIEQTDLHLANALFINYIKKGFSQNFRKDHWISNGLGTYILKEYVNTFYSDKKLTGSALDFKVLGMKPLKLWYASKVPLFHRFRIGYQFIASRNQDQPIAGKDWQDYSNINRRLISEFKSGIGFNYLASYIGKKNFRNTINKLDVHTVLSKEYLEESMKNNHSKELNWFFDDLIYSTEKIDFRINNFDKKKNELRLTNKKQFSGPIPLDVLYNNDTIKKVWIEGFNKDTIISLKDSNYKKFVLNNSYTVPEINLRNNYINAKGLFKNGKNVQFKFLTDIEKPEYSQIFVNPGVKWNNYDKLLLSMSLSNRAIFQKPFLYVLKPSYSIGTSSVAGSIGLSHDFYPTHYSGIRKWTVGGGMRTFHYDKDLAYFSSHGYLRVDFRKNNPRDPITSAAILSYDYLNKESPIDPDLINPNELYNGYSITRATYYYESAEMIHDLRSTTSLEVSELYTKISTDFRYQYALSKGMKLGWRFFGGVLLNDDTPNNYFGFGISNVNDYALKYNLLGRSESDGLLSQQIIDQEGILIAKTPFVRSNQYFLSSRTDFNFSPILGVFAHAALAKNRNESPQFLWDSGVHFKFIPDFLELYLPLYSSNGNELKGNYWKKIRFTFSLNLGKAFQYIRRGLF